MDGRSGGGLTLTVCFLAICITVFQVTSCCSLVWLMNTFSLLPTSPAKQMYASSSAK